MRIEIGNTVSIQYGVGRLGEHTGSWQGSGQPGLGAGPDRGDEKAGGKPIRHPDIYFAFTTQEEVGCRGAKTAAYNIVPDSAVALDITIANDTPGISSNKNIVELDRGPAIKVMDRLATSHMGMISAPSIVRRMKQVAKENDIPYQLEVFMEGSTDAATIHLERGGIPSGAILLPSRYVHAHEVISGRDMTAMIELLVHYLRSLGG